MENLIFQMVKKETDGDFVTLPVLHLRWSSVGNMICCGEKKTTEHTEHTQRERNNKASSSEASKSDV